jgi:hypothetical protein
VLGAVAFAAAGGVGVIRTWLATTTVDGNVVDTREITVGEDHTATFEVPAAGATETTVTLENTGGSEGGEVVVNVAMDGTKASVTVKDAKSESEKKKDDDK